MYMDHEDVPEPDVADLMEFTSWPEDKQRLAQRVCNQSTEFLPYPRNGNSTLLGPK